MRKIKIRYIYVNRFTGKTRAQIVTLDDIENGGLYLGWINKILSEDAFINMFDKDEKELYEKDIVYSKTYIEGVELLGWIEFNEDRGTYQVNLGSNQHPLTDINAAQMKYFEKKGNAIDNPELLNEVGRPRSEVEGTLLDRLKQVNNKKE